MTVAILKNSFEGGTNSTTITAANSGVGSGDAFDSVTSGISYSSTTAAHGGLSMTVTDPGSGVERAAWDVTTGDVLVRAYFRFDAAPTTNASILNLAGASGNVSLTWRASGYMQLYAGGDRGTYFSTLSANTWYRAEVYRTTTSVRWALYEGDSETATYTSTQANGLSLGNMVRVDIGKIEVDASTVHRYLDDVGIKTGTDAVWGAWPVTNSLPLVTPGPDQNVAPSTNVTLSFTATDEDGVIASRQTGFDYPTTGAPAITDGTTSTPSFATGASKGNLYVVRHTATDDQGGQGHATTEVRVPLDGGATMTTLPMPATHQDGGWTVVGAANAGAALADASDTTYVESGDLTSTPQSYRVRLQPSHVKSTGKITRRLGTDTGTAAATIRLYEGDTLREQWNQTVDATPTNYDFTLAAATVSAITDWGNLHVDLSVVES